MILDNLNTTLAEYGDMGVKFAKAFRWLRETDLTSFTPGQKVTIDGERVFAQIQGYETVRPEEALFETHRVYADIQVMVQGREVMQWAPLAELGKVKIPYDFEKDLVFFEEPDVCRDLLLEAGDFAIFFPSDGHKPRCRANGSEKVLKIIVKVAM